MSVHSEEESLLLHDMMEVEDQHSSSFWLGGRRPADSPQWRWSDGSRQEYCYLPDGEVETLLEGGTGQAGCLDSPALARTRTV